ncbi:ECF transporter S component [Weissella koreensis]|uniref:ECF transporter S component n=1 Tax=Weissella koreensis TaxID=165096 RepID=A0A7H1MK27_9LACO|nr:ECF transporter S component [Weissella koreensis]AEJ22950.1 hypothetical protein WKK_00370 [Weissella koreensis KACC 15510]AVH74554.1 ECF transporter S component [Weissella koreensis]EJF33903.1 hypothetical protein JC2156_02110 [Weissella koreensis KCTC 3621]EJF34193.1 hypothetical protein JC2156_00750 [Weissella koreensis KCTC 3621]MCZ9310389.1 ECF transporter S component [Weissella koreensis]
MYSLKPIYQRTIVAVIIALNIVANFFLKIPTPTGFISLVEVGIFLMSWLFGRRAGGITGALTGFLIDLISGYPQWMLFSMIIHGSEGWLIGLLTRKNARLINKLISIIGGGLIMVGGYFISGIILQLWNHVTLNAALTITFAEIFGNCLQVAIGAGIALILLPILERNFRNQSNIFK